MTSHVARLYALTAGVLVFFLAWAAVAAHPWQASAAKTDPRLVALQLREQRLRAESLAVRRIVDRRWTLYRSQLAARRRQIASAGLPAATAPPVRVVTLPPLTITRTS